MLFKLLINLPRPQKRLVSLCIDTVFIFTAFWLAFILRLDNLAEFHDSKTWVLFFTVLPLSLLTFVKLGLYRAVLRYLNSQAVWAILAGVISFDSPKYLAS